MKILVCFKVVRDVDYILKEDWVDICNNCMDFSYVRNLLNCYDEGALENALRLKDLLKENGEDVILDAITTSELNTDLFNKLILAAGFSSLTVLKREADYFNPIENAETIFEYIKDNDYDLVLTGFENALGNNGVFPYKLASLLNYPVLNKVTEFSLNCGIICKVEGETEFNYYKLNSKAVLIFKNTENSCLRFPSLMDRLNAKNKDEKEIEINELKNNSDQLATNLYRKEDNTKVNMLSGENIDKVQTILMEVENA